MLRGILTGSVQNLGYSFDPATGNLFSRKDNLRSLIEIFTYDNLNRLTGVSGPAPLTMSYSPNGNILSKTSVGNYSYGAKPHAVTSVTNTDGLIPTTTQRVTCTSFNKADSVIQGNLIYTLKYGHADQRTMSRLYDNGILQKTVYYVGGYEKEVKPGNHVRQLHYIAGGDGIAAIFVRNDGMDTLYYIHTDHLGSINVITNQSGAVVRNCSFDAWGRRRNPVNWTYNNVPSTYLFSRGFTGHEHLDQFVLINMNGRIYDPVLGRFLSTDNYVQSPDFTQAFNRYTYCLNNPLVYTDPSGDFIFTILAAIFCPPLIPAAMQVDMAWIGGGFNSMANGGTFWDGAWRGGVTGLINAGFSFLNVPGMLPNGFLHAGTNILGNGISNSLFDKPFFDNWGASAGTGFAGGAYSGYGLAKEGGLNYWWGTKSENWGYNRDQWSLAWWDKPDVARSPIRSVAGEFSNGCVPTGMQAISDSYGLTNQDQYFWKTEYQNYTGTPFNGVDPNKFEGFVEFVNGYNVDNITGTGDVFSNIMGGKRVGMGVANYGSSGANHFMVVKKMLSWPNGNFRMVMMNPDGGGIFTINKRNFFTYGPRFWSIFR